MVGVDLYELSVNLRRDIVKIFNHILECMNESGQFTCDVLLGTESREYTFDYMFNEDEQKYIDVGIVGLQFKYTWIKNLGVVDFTLSTHINYVLLVDTSFFHHSELNSKCFSGIAHIVSDKSLNGGKTELINRYPYLKIQDICVDLSYIKKIQTSFQIDSTLLNFISSIRNLGDGDRVIKLIFSETDCMQLNSILVDFLNILKEMKLDNTMFELDVWLWDGLGDEFRRSICKITQELDKYVQCTY